MIALIKLILILMAAALIVYCTGFLIIDQLPLQIFVLVFVLLLCAFRFNIRKVINELKLLLPFVIIMLCIYIVLGLAGFGFSVKAASESKVISALIFGLIRCALFISTVLIFQFILSFISMQDILNLPFGIRYKKSMILGRALFIHSLKHWEEVEAFLHLIPEYQKTKLSFRQWYWLKLQLTLALFFMILRESYQKGELIDNRIRHCFYIKSRETL
jgi:hypothetical protein